MKGKLPAPPSERDVFVQHVLHRANGQRIEARDAVLALLTALDVEALSRHTGQSRDILVNERLSARRRVLQALGGD